MKMKISRRDTFLGLVSGLACAGQAQAQAQAQAKNSIYTADFLDFWQHMSQKYCYFDLKATDWNKVKTVYQPLACKVASIDDFKVLLQSMIVELYDSHSHVNDLPDGVWRFPPFDIYAQNHNDAASVVAVLERSNANTSGIKTGDLITHVSGMPLASVMSQIAPKCLRTPDPVADAYVLNAAIGGRRGQDRHFTVLRDGKAFEVNIARLKFDNLPDLSFERLGTDIGYIAIRSFGDMATLEKFDTALESLKDTRALIIDVRNNGGGDTALARPIMGRFIKQKRAYAIMRKRKGAHLGKPWSEYVEPRGPFTYAGKVVVLCNRFSASMAEGFPMGMKGIGAATIIGTPMMHLEAAVNSHKLKRTGVSFQYSAEPVHDVNDRPRNDFMPDIIVPDAYDILQAAKAYLNA